MEVEFQLFKPCYYTPLQHTGEGFFGNNLVRRFSYLSLTNAQTKIIKR